MVFSSLAKPPVIDIQIGIHDFLFPESSVVPVVAISVTWHKVVEIICDVFVVAIQLVYFL